VWTPFAQRCSIWIEETLGDAGGANLAQVTTLCENEAYGRYRNGRTHTNHGRCGDGDWQQYLTGPQPTFPQCQPVKLAERPSRLLCCRQSWARRAAATAATPAPRSRRTASTLRTRRA